MLCRSGDELVFEDGRRRREGSKNKDVLDFWKNAASLLGNLQGLLQRNGSCHLLRADGKIFGVQACQKLPSQEKCPKQNRHKKWRLGCFPQRTEHPRYAFPCVTVTALTMQCYFAHVMTSYTSTVFTLSILPLERRPFSSSFTCCSTESYSYTAAAWQTSFYTSAYHLLGLTKDTGD